MHGMEGHGMGNGNVVAADSHIESSCLNRKEKLSRSNNNRLQRFRNRSKFELRKTNELQ